jgi:hypothetical protein
VTGAASRRERLRRHTIAASLLIAIAALAAPIPASADLPNKPACSALTGALLKSRFGFTFSNRSSSQEHHTPAVDHLSCRYTSRDGDLTIAYNRYSSDRAARSRYSSDKKSLIRRGNGGSGLTINQILPLIKLHGIGDMALRSTDGTIVEFTDGIDCVRIENGFAAINSRTTREIVALATYVDRNG